jgi:hypothetical protein
VSVDLFFFWFCFLFLKERFRYFIHHWKHFSTPYQSGSPSEQLQALVVMAKASLELLCQLHVIPSIVVTNDWFTGLVILVYGSLTIIDVIFPPPPPKGSRVRSKDGFFWFQFCRDDFFPSDSQSGRRIRGTTRNLSFFWARLNCW